MAQQNITTIQDILDALDRDPDLQREFHKHLVDVIRKDDVLREEIRKEILTEELLQLPARFTRLEEKVSQIRQDVDQIREDVDQIKQDVDQIKQDNSRMSGQIANLMGSDYESKAIEQSRRLVRRHLGMDHAILLYASRGSSAEFENDVLLPAIRQGRIDRDQADRLEDADSIIRCQDEQGNIVCAVVEISMTVQDHDRSRAAERARIFSMATGLYTLPFVVGQEQAEPGPQSPDVPFLPYRQ